MSIEFIKGDCLQESDTKRVICHIVTNAGGLGKGFALALAKKYPEVRKAYKTWYDKYRPYAAASNGGDNKYIPNQSLFKLGNNQYVPINDKLLVVNMLCQKGYKSEKNPVPLDYDSLEFCLYKVEDNTRSEIWMPDLIGCGLAGGDREKVLDIIDDTFKDRKVKIFKL